MKRGVVLISIVVVAAAGAAAVRAAAVPRSREAGRARARDRCRRGEQGADRAAPADVVETGRSRSARRGAPTTCAGAGSSRSTRRATATRALAAGSLGSLLVSHRVDVAPVVAPSGRRDQRPAADRTLQPRPGRRHRLGARDDGHDDPGPRRACGSIARRCSAASRSTDRCSRPPTSGCGRRSATRPPRQRRRRRGSCSRGRWRSTTTVPVSARSPPCRSRALLRIDGADVRLDGERLAQVIRPRLGRWIVRAHNAQFVVARSRVRIVPSRPGRDVDGRQFAAAVTKAAHGDHVAHVELGPRAPDLTTAKAEGARDPAGARLVHHADGRVVVEPHPQRAPDGRLHRRHDRRARARSSRSTTSSAREPRSAGSSRARRSSDRSCCRRSAAASVRRRRRSSTMRSRSGCRFSRARTTTSISRTIRSAATRRWRGAVPTSASRTT